MGQPLRKKTMIVVDLSHFEGNIHLTPEEKRFRIDEYQKLLDVGEIDEEMIQYLNELNNIENVCTTQSCCGHGEDDSRIPHVDIRIGYKFDSFFMAISELLREEDVKLQIMGEEMNMPRFCFWFNSKSWKSAVESLIKCLRKQSRRET